MTINHIHLRKLDLNLMLAFDALMECRSVSGAAARLSLGQPAMSHALRRLRDLFGDPLLVREGGGLVPTDQALALWRPITDALHDLEAGLARAQGFDPTSACATFSISMADYVANLLVPPLVGDIREVAPGVAIRIESLGREEGLAALSEGRIDAVIGVADPPDWVVAERLFSDGFATLYDPGCWPSPPDDLDRFCAAPHALASQAPSFEGWVDQALATHGRSRRVVVSATRFADAAACVRGSDMLLTLPSMAARHYAVQLGLAICDPPIEGSTFDVQIFRRRRSVGAPNAEWLARTLRDVSEEVFGA